MTPARLFLSVLAFATSLANASPVSLTLSRDAVTIPLRRVHNRLLVWAQVASVDQSAEGWFLLDTGASLTAIDSRVADALHLERTGEMPLRTGGLPIRVAVARVVKITVRTEGARIDSSHLITMITDMREMSRSFGVPVAGVIGADVLSTGPVEIDWPRGALTFSHSLKPGPKSKPFPLDRVGSDFGIRAVVEGDEQCFQIDTGLEWGMTLHPPLVNYHRLPASLRLQPFPHTLTASGEWNEWRFVARNVRVLGQSLDNTWVQATESDDPRFAGQIGAELLRDLRLSFDWQAGKVWVDGPEELTADALTWELKRRAEQDVSGVTAMMLAAERGRPDVIRRLLAGKADPNAVSRWGFTALVLAADAGRPEAVEALLAAGASPDASDPNTRSALYAACERGDLSNAKLLLAHRAEPNLRAVDDETALFPAVRTGSIPLIRALIDAGGKLNLSDRHGNTVFLQARTVPVAKELLARGARKDASNDLGETLLMRTAGLPEMVRYLIESGADVNARSKRGVTPLIAATFANSADSIELLLDHGAKPATRSEEGKCAWDYAVERGLTDSVRALLPARLDAELADRK